MPKSKEYVSSSEDSDYAPEERPKKKSKPSPTKPKATATKTTANGEEEMFPLSKMRFASVSEFRGKKLVNIREYYDKDGQMLPGRKGISLTVEQWGKLKDAMGDLDELLKA